MCVLSKQGVGNVVGIHNEWWQVMTVVSVKHINMLSTWMKLKETLTTSLYNNFWEKTGLEINAAGNSFLRIPFPFSILLI